MKKRLASFFLVLLLAASVFPLSPACAGTDGNISWSIADGVLTISGKGDIPNYYNYWTGTPNLAPWLDGQPFTEVVIKKGITGISYGLFSKYKNIRKITLPKSLKTIDDQAFAGCAALTGIRIPSGIDRIGDSVFADCSALRSVSLPDGLVSVGNSAFADCAALQEIDLPDGVTEIGEKAFYYCKSLKKVHFPDSLTRIGNWAFLGCKALKEIPLSAAWNIGDGAFRLTGVTSLSIPADLDYLRCDVGKVFGGCPLKTITVEDGHPHYFTRGKVLYFNSYDPRYTLDPASITLTLFPAGLNKSRFVVPDDVDYIGAFAFYKSKLSEIQIPDSVQGIRTAAFGYSGKLKSIRLPEGIREIPGSTFMYCKSLISLTIPEGVTSIGNEALMGCSSLTSVTLPHSLTQVGTEVFFYCETLKDIYYNGTSKEWKKISIDRYNDSLDQARIHCLRDEAERTATVSGGKYSLEPERGTAILMGPAKSSASSLKIPATIRVKGKSYKVTAIADSACKGMKELKKLSVGRNVKTIGTKAFSGCTNLKSIEIHSVLLTAKTVGNGAFKNVYKKVTIKCPKEKLEIYSSILEDKGMPKKAKYMAIDE